MTETPRIGNEKQRETVEMLLSEIDNLEVALLREQALGLPEDGDVLVFEGSGIEGPSIGYIETDGSISWISGC